MSTKKELRQKEIDEHNELYEKSKTKEIKTSKKEARANRAYIEKMLVGLGFSKNGML